MTKAELRSAIDEAKTMEELETLKQEIENVTDDVVDAESKVETPVEETEVKPEVVEITSEEERSLLRDVVEERKLDLRKVEDLNMEERKAYDFEKEYRNAWAKTLMGLPENKFTENEKRALGDAVTTTATTFVEADADTQGINNGGLFIPVSVRAEFMERLSLESPIFRDVRKLAVASNIDLPYIHEADNAYWAVELESTKNEGIEFKSIRLTGNELVKNIDITWKAEKMTVGSFIDYILDELQEKMGEAMINAVIYGTGSNEPTGITNDLTPVTDGENVIDVMLNTYKSLSARAMRGAKIYISNKANADMISYKDENGNYPFLAGVSALPGAAIEVDPYLANNDVVAGNMKNYLFNEVAAAEVIRSVDGKTRRVSYTGYGIFDGAPKANMFAYGQFTEASI